MNDPNASPVTLAQDSEKLQELMQNAQMIMQLESTLSSIRASMEKQAIENMRVQ